MGRGEVSGLLTPMNGRIVGCHGKTCGYTSNPCEYIIEKIRPGMKFGCGWNGEFDMSNLLLGLAKSFAKKCEKAVDNCHMVW